eukprot:154042_1
MGHADSPATCIKYIDIMLNKYGLIPDHITFGSLIKGCRYQCNYDLATKYWNMMEEYNVVPNIIHFTEYISVCSAANQRDKAIEVFQRCVDADLPLDLPLLSTYINIFSRCGDVDGLENALKLLNEHRFPVDKYIATDVMRCYHIARQPTHLINYYLEYAKNGGELDAKVMHLKCTALVSLLKDDIENKYSLEAKEKLYLELEDTVHRKLKMHGITITPTLAFSHLSGAVCFYRYHDPMKAVEVLRTLVDNQLIRYKERKNMIDLHHFPKIEAQFILRYIIGFELKDLLSESDALYLIVGYGKHAVKREQLKQFVIQDLLRYDPPIAATSDPTNAGRLVIEKCELSPYLNNEMNYAKQRLTNPSNDWYWDDPRRAKKRITSIRCKTKFGCKRFGCKRLTTVNNFPLDIFMKIIDFCKKNDSAYNACAAVNKH